MVRVERQIRRARLQDAEDPDQVLERAVGEDADPLLGLDAARQQAVRDPVRVALELAVGEPARALGRRERVGPLGRARREELVEARVLGDPGRGKAVLHCSMTLTLSAT